MRRYFYACMITAICFCNGSLQAQHTLVLKENEHDIAISPHAFVFTGNAALDGIDSLLHSDSSRFLRNHLQHEIDYGVDKTRGWCAFVVRNESNQRDWILKIQHSRVDTVQLFVVRSNKMVERFPMTGHFQTLTNRPVQSLPFAYNLSIEKNETVFCYLYTARQYGRHAAILNFQTKEYFESYEYAFNAILGFVCGMVFLASFVGFFLFVFVRDRMYVYYSIYALSFLFVLLADTGLAQAVRFFLFDQTVVNGFTMIAYYWMGGWLGIFTIELLRLKQNAKRWVYLLGIVLSYSCCIIALLLLIPWLPNVVRGAFISSSYYLAITINVFTLYVLSISVCRKEPIVYFYMAGFFFTSLIALLLTLADFHLINFPSQNKDVYFLTPLVEILCVAVGIGIHFSRTLKERINVQLVLNQTQDQIITIQENERRRIAQDLHDDVGNSLAAIRNMVTLQRSSKVVETEIDNLVTTVRTISHDLMPVDFSQFSLNDIIEHLVTKFKDHPTLSLEFDYTGIPVKIKSTTELVIYRIINEIISNMMKHSKATQGFIQLVYQKESLVITAEDNGIGINTTSEEGIGLRSIRSRAAYINATITFESDNKGTLIILEVPYGNIE
jgi:signal transduction histidine kinase